MITVTKTIRTSLEEVLKEAPAGMVPMFFIGSAKEDDLLGESVYLLKDGHLYLAMTDERISVDLVSGLQFARYVSDPKIK